MGDPIPVEVEGRKVWTCCAACPPKLKAEPGEVPGPARRRRRGTRSSACPSRRSSTPAAARSSTSRAEPGVFEGREVVLGPRVGDRFPVLEGLAPGEKVAAAGAFLIDAESRLNPATAPATPARAPPAKADDAADPIRRRPTPERPPALSRAEDRP